MSSEREQGREEGVEAAIRALGAMGLDDSHDRLDSPEGRDQIRYQLEHADLLPSASTTLRLFVQSLAATLADRGDLQLAQLCIDVLAGSINPTTMRIKTIK